MRIGLKWIWMFVALVLWTVAAAMALHDYRLGTFEELSTRGNLYCIALLVMFWAALTRRPE